MTLTTQAATRDQLRRGRKREVRPQTPQALSGRRATQAERRHAAAMAAHYDANRVLPLTRGDCADGPRPCPLVSCRYHLALDMDPRRGSIKLNFPDLEIWEMPETCALDVADRGGETLEAVGELLNVTRERARQLQGIAVRKLKNHEAKRLQEMRELAAMLEEESG
jgi:hypothetical protein